MGVHLQSLQLVLTTGLCSQPARPATPRARNHASRGSLHLDVRPDVCRGGPVCLGFAGKTTDGTDGTDKGQAGRSHPWRMRQDPTTPMNPCDPCHPWFLALTCFRLAPRPTSGPLRPTPTSPTGRSVEFTPRRPICLDVTALSLPWNLLRPPFSGSSS